VSPKLGNRVIKGVKRTTAALVMREMVDYRITPLVETLTD
jgi:hypothetical protein